MSYVADKSRNVFYMWIPTALSTPSSRVDIIPLQAPLALKDGDGDLFLSTWFPGAGAGGAEGEEAGGEAASQDGEVLVSEGAPFETHLWRARLAIQRATNAMLAAYEVCVYGDFLSWIVMFVVSSPC